VITVAPFRTACSVSHTPIRADLDDRAHSRRPGCGTVIFPAPVTVSFSGEARECDMLEASTGC
jgi:hypothetical protein